MKKIILFLLFILLSCPSLFAQDEIFEAPVELNMLPDNASDRYRLQHPFDIQIGPDDNLWVTTKSGIISIVDPKTGKREIIADLSDVIEFTRFRNNQGVITRVAQDGLLGFAVDPLLGTSTDHNFVYLAYIYDADPGNNLDRKLRIARYRYAEAGGMRLLVNPETLIEDMPGSNDHNSGRLLYGPDNKLYYTVGDQGANQGGNRCNPIQSQFIPTASEVNNKDWYKYAGKTLRLNLDGSIPDDNPVIEGVKSHIYTYGHRNPQGLIFERNSQGLIPTNAKLYGNEHGHRTDDEVNQIIEGKNYGWPIVAGFKDDIGYSHFNWSSSADCPNSSTNACNPPNDAEEIKENEFTATNFQEPLRSFYVDPDPPCNGFLDFPTIAPSSMEYYYHQDAIPDWQNSLLVTSLKRGTIYRLKLNDDGTAIAEDTEPLLTMKNRYRDIAISKDGLSLYVLTDSLGSTSFAAGTNNQTLENRGSILRFDYKNAVSTDQLNAERTTFSVFPNPAKYMFTVKISEEIVPDLYYQILDISGRIIQNEKVRDARFQVFTEDFRPGIYFIQLTNQNTGFQQRQKVAIIR